MKFLILVSVILFVSCKGENSSTNKSASQVSVISSSLTSSLIDPTLKYATGSADCVVRSLQDWIKCKTKIENRSAKKVLIENSFTCNTLDNCALYIGANNDIGIWSTNGATIKRLGGFDKPFISIVSSSNVDISNLKLEESINSPVQPTPGAQEVNKDCQAVSCKSIISIFNSNNIILDRLSLSNGKVFGISLAESTDVHLNNSTINNSWWFGVWGSKNKKVKFTKSKFLNNRSNGILIDTSYSEETLLLQNLFQANHHATAFHTCGSDGKTPCPGGQLDIVHHSKNVLIEGNTFENGAMSMEFPEDANYNWIAGIEFEGKIESTTIRNNIIRNNSGAPFYLNMPKPDARDTFFIDLLVENNTFCNNRTSNFYGSEFIWDAGVKLLNNSDCAAESIRYGTITASSCSVPSSTSTCNSTVTWSIPNYPNACIWVGNTLWACEGNNKTKIYPYLTTAGTDFIVRAGNTLNSQELNRTRAQATLNSTTPPPPAITHGNITASSCSVPNTASTCNSTVTWSIPNFPNACIWVGNTLWACEGNNKTKTYPYLTTAGTDFIVRAGNTLNSQELNRTRAEASISMSATNSNGTISASSCFVTSSSSTCSSTINWSVPNFPNACIWAGTTLWACEGKSGSKVYPYATSTGIYLTIRANSNATSQELIKIFVSAQLK